MAVAEVEIFPRNFHADAAGRGRRPSGGPPRTCGCAAPRLRLRRPRSLCLLVSIYQAAALCHPHPFPPDRLPESAPRLCPDAPGFTSHDRSGTFLVQQAFSRWISTFYSRSPLRPKCHCENPLSRLSL